MKINWTFPFCILKSSYYRGTFRFKAGAAPEYWSRTFSTSTHENHQLQGTHICNECLQMQRYSWRLHCSVFQLRAPCHGKCEAEISRYRDINHKMQGSKPSCKLRGLRKVSTNDAGRHMHNIMKRCFQGSTNFMNRQQFCIQQIVWFSIKVRCPQYSSKISNCYMKLYKDTYDCSWGVLRSHCLRSMRKFINAPIAKIQLPSVLSVCSAQQDSNIFHEFSFIIALL